MVKLVKSSRFMSAHQSFPELKRLEWTPFLMLYEQQEVMCLVPAALASLGWFVVVNEAEKMFGSEWNTMLFYHCRASAVLSWISSILTQDVCLSGDNFGLSLHPVKLNPNFNIRSDLTKNAVKQWLYSMKMSAIFNNSSTTGTLTGERGQSQSAPSGFSSIIGSYL